MVLVIVIFWSFANYIIILTELTKIIGINNPNPKFCFSALKMLSLSKYFILY